MIEERKRFERYLQEYRPSLWHALDMSTHDPRWGMASSERDALWYLWRVAARV